ncbi:MAG: hypothetical protein MI975_00380 [Cytophagales bacterium]|nr:hypothetical protein [Cytophagales bacterium]
MIVVLTFNHPHRKTQDLIFRLMAMGVKPLVVSTEWEERKNFKPIITHRPGNPVDMDLEIMCKNLGLDFVLTTKKGLYADLCKIESIEYILLATGNIIEKEIVTQFKVINAHPAYLPIVKGLDALKWAILYDETIGVTTHFVNEEIDGGIIIERRKVPLYYEDSFHNLAYRQYELEVEMLANAIHCTSEHIPVGKSKYETFRRMPHRLEMRMLENFEKRKRGLPFGNNG